MLLGHLNPMIKKYTFEGENLKIYKSNAEKDRKNPMALASKL